MTSVTTFLCISAASKDFNKVAKLHRAQEASKAMEEYEAARLAVRD